MGAAFVNVLPLRPPLRRQQQALSTRLPAYPTNSARAALNIPNTINTLQKISAILVHPLPCRAYPWRMFSLARLRKEPALARYFAFVHPFFWPVLIWQLARAVEEVRAAGRSRAMLRVMWWGGVHIEYLGDAAPNPSAHRPVEPTRKPWSDPCWSSAVPAIFNADESHTLFFPRICGGFEGKAFALQAPREGMKGACARAARPDTS